MFDLSSTTLHIMAMIFMLMDHLWATLFPAQEWLTCVGRIAFPIFAFMTVEGYFHTHNFKKYLTRMFIFALLSEIPFDLMYGGTVFYPYHQNVIWTFSLIYIRGYNIGKCINYSRNNIHNNIYYNWTIYENKSRIKTRRIFKRRKKI